MPDFPVARWPVLNTVSIYSVESYGLVLPRLAEGIANANSVAPGANVVFYAPFLLHEPATAQSMSYFVGGVSNGNVALGLYDSGKTRLVTSASTGQGSINTFQNVDITDTALTPGLYFMAITTSSATGTLFTQDAVDEASMSLFPIYQETTGGFGLPSTAAFAASTVATPSIPSMCVHFSSLV